MSATERLLPRIVLRPKDGPASIGRYSVRTCMRMETNGGRVPTLAPWGSVVDLRMHTHKTRGYLG